MSQTDFYSAVKWIAAPRNNNDRDQWRESALEVAAACKASVQLLTGPHVDADVFLGNSDTREVHHQNLATGSCQLEELSNPVLFESLATARDAGFDPCGFCFRSKH